MQAGDEVVWGVEEELLLAVAVAVGRQLLSGLAGGCPCG